MQGGVAGAGARAGEEEEKKEAGDTRVHVSEALHETATPPQTPVLRREHEHGGVDAAPGVFSSRMDGVHKWRDGKLVKEGVKVYVEGTNTLAGSALHTTPPHADLVRLDVAGCVNATWVRGGKMWLGPGAAVCARSEPVMSMGGLADQYSVFAIDISSTE
ncbi:hypothetical protein JB92DRAFT_2830980 [Gautieria morchelliformis]|nr:hypothetical protein JB92DRAFT_2830980 [Gautieria morchelliformis]